MAITISGVCPPNDQGAIPPQLLPFSLLPHPPFPSLPGSPLLFLPSPLHSPHAAKRALKTMYGSGVSPILVYCEREKAHLTAIIIWIFVY